MILTRVICLRIWTHNLCETQQCWPCLGVSKKRGTEITKKKKNEQDYQFSKCPSCRVQNVSKHYKIETLLSRFLSKYLPLDLIPDCIYLLSRFFCLPGCGRRISFDSDLHCNFNMIAILFAVSKFKIQKGLAWMLKDAGKEWYHSLGEFATWLRPHNWPSGRTTLRVSQVGNHQETPLPPLSKQQHDRDLGVETGNSGPVARVSGY